MSARLDYDQKPEKTRGGELVSSYMCSPDTAAQEFEISRQMYYHLTGRSQPTGRDVLMYRIIQSFKPGEVTPEQAHEIACELAMRFTEGQYQFVVATHTDKAHIHSHIEFNYGVPYVQENCALDHSDNVVIYGHHMNNGSMFADLCKYESENFYREHTTIRFDTLSGFGEYEIVAVFKTVAYSEQGFKYYHFVNAADEDDFNAFISQCKALALYDTGVGAEYGDKLLTLSTCEYSRTNGRMVVVAKLITPEAGGNA